MPQGRSAHRPTAYPARPEASTRATGHVPRHPQARGQENAPDQRGLFSQPGTAPPEPPLHRDQLVAAEPRTAAQPAPPRTRRPPPAGSSTTRENWPFCASRGSADLPPQARRIRRYAPNVRFRPPGGCLPSVTELSGGRMVTGRRGRARSLPVAGPLVSRAGRMMIQSRSPAVTRASWRSLSANSARSRHGTKMRSNTNPQWPRASPGQIAAPS